LIVIKVWFIIIKNLQEMQRKLAVVGKRGRWSLDTTCNLVYIFNGYTNLL